MKMPKLKSKSAAKKRFTATGTGKIKRNQAYKRHCLACKSQKMKRNARGTTIVDATNVREITRFLPYL
jgi:large subunit ribosomal protein L35